MIDAGTAASDDSESTGDGATDRRSIGLARMSEVYGWEVGDGPGDFFSMTVEHLFAEVWTREQMDDRERRLLLIGMAIGGGLDDVAELQIDAGLRLGQFDDEFVREIVIMATHYAGWPRGAKLNSAVEKLIAKRRRQPDTAE